MGVTKSDFCRGMQCEKMLWLDSHHPELKVIPDHVKVILDKGNDYGDSLMGIFGPYVEVTAYKENGRLDYGKMIENTKSCLDDGTNVICEAAFSFYGNYCAVDILRKVDGGYELYEVKNSDSLKPQHIMDAGFQRYIISSCGVNVLKCAVITGKTEDYIIHDISKDSLDYAKIVKDNIFRLGKIKKQDLEVNKEVGSHCESPYRCWYYDYCHKK